MMLNDLPVPQPLRTTFDAIVQPAPPFHRAAVLRMVDDYETAFHGEEGELAALDAFLNQHEQRCMLLRAPTGRGKTSLLIHWLGRVAAAGQWHTVFVPITMRYHIATPGITLRALAQSLAAFHNDHDNRHIYNQSLDQIRPLIASYLYSDAPPGCRLLLVVDGLDETAGWSIGRDIFPSNLGKNLHILVSVRALPDALPHMWLEQLGWQREHTRIMTLAPLSNAAAGDLLRDLCAPLASPEQASAGIDLPAEIRRISEDDPHTMRLLARALHDGTLAPDQLPTMPPGLHVYIYHWLQELEQRSEQARGISALLGLCATAMSALSSEDVLELAPEVFPDAATLQQTARMLDGLLVGDGSDENGYVFDHLRLREIFREHIFSQREQRQLHQRFVAYGQEWYDGSRPTLTNYIRRYWIEHLAEAGEWERIGHVLTSIASHDEGMVQRWVNARFSVEGNYVNYLSDLDIFWRWSEQHTNSVAASRCALIASTLRTMSGNLLPELLERLVAVGTPGGRWSMALALRQVRQMSAPGQKVKALSMLVGCCAHAFPRDLVLDVFHSFTDERWQAEALAVLVPLLPAEALSGLTAQCRAMSDNEARSRGLGALAPHLPPAQQATIYEDMFAAVRALKNDRTRSRALAPLIPSLPVEVLPDAHAIVATMGEGRWKTEALAALAAHPAAARWPSVSAQALALARHFVHHGRFAEALPILSAHLPPAQQAETYTDLLDAIRAISHAGSKSLSLAAIAPYLPPSQQTAIYLESLAAARTIADQKQRVRILPPIVAQLPRARQATIYEEELSAACDCADEQERADSLYVLAHHMPTLPHSSGHPLAESALAAAHAISDERGRARALTALLRHLPPDERPAVCEEVLDAAHHIGDEWQRSEVLAALSPHLPAEQMSRLLVAARTIADEWQRAEALILIAANQPEPQQQRLYGESLAACRAIADRLDYLRLLAALLPHLPPSEHLPLIEEARITAAAIPDQQQRTDALIEVAPHLPPDHNSHDLYTEMLTTLEASSNPRWCIEALLKLAPALPPALHASALAFAGSFENSVQRINVLAALAPHLSSDQQHRAYVEVLETTRLHTDEWQRSEILHRLAPRMPARLRAEALRDACSLEHERYRSHALVGLMPHLSTEQQAQALVVVQRAENETWLAEALTAIVPVLDAALRPEVLVLAHALNDTTSRARVLSSIAPFLPPEQMYAAVAEALEAARAIGYVRWRADVLVALSPHLTVSLQAEAIEIARAISDAEERCRVLAALALHRPTTLMPEALEAATAISDEEKRAEALTALADNLPSSLVREALAAIHALQSEELRAHSLLALAPHAPPEQQPPIYNEALNAARAVASGQQCAATLCLLAPRMPANQQAMIYAEALAAVRSISDEEERTAMLAETTRHLVAWTGASPANALTAQPLLHASLRFFASPGRPLFFNSLAALMPWVATLATPDELAHIARAIIEVVRCWR
jgi:hypothetical protein